MVSLDPPVAKDVLPRDEIDQEVSSFPQSNPEGGGFFALNVPDHVKVVGTPAWTPLLGETVRFPPVCAHAAGAREAVSIETSSAALELDRIIGTPLDCLA